MLRRVARKTQTQQITIASTNPALERSSRRGMRRAGDGFLSSMALAMVYFGGGGNAFLLCL